MIGDALQRPARAVHSGAETYTLVRALDRLEKTLVVRRALVLGTCAGEGEGVVTVSVCRSRAVTCVMMPRQEVH